jgi:hypothetical protein
MTRKRFVIYVVCLLLIVMAVSLSFGYGVATAELRTPPTATPESSDWECPAGQTCHVLLQPGSEVWLLTADGRIRLDVFGADSGLAGNVGVLRD